VLGLSAVGLVILQGVLGGITVLFLLPKAVSIGHAVVAHLFFLVTVTLYQVTAPRWRGLRDRRRGSAPRRLKVLGLVTVGAMLLELFLGATVRHNAAGLAIPDFPLAYGRIIPPLSAFPIVIHFLHRVGALLVIVAVVVTLMEAVRRHGEEPLLIRPALLMGGLLVLQLALGAVVIWSRLAVPLTTLHVTNGALLTGVAALLTLRAFRLEQAMAASAT
jgi:cytochrome c oxidase assembly protein subunit 15